MDRSWIRNRNVRHGQEYLEGIESFIEVAIKHLNKQKMTICPCIKCLNKKNQTIPVIRMHLAKDGEKLDVPPTPFVQDHLEPNDVIQNILNDAFPIVQEEEDVDMNEDEGDDIGGTIDSFSNQGVTDSFSNQGVTDSIGNQGANVHRLQADKYEELLADAQREFFPGCDRHSVLTTMVKLMHCKVLNHWTNKSFDTLMKTLNQLCPKPNNIPLSFYEANKMLKKLGLGYKNIHVCRNDCVLFYGKYAKRKKCPVCKEDRYKPSSTSDDGKKKKKVPYKVLRYFPLKPRLERLFMSSRTAIAMRWHKERRVDQNDVMRHPADSLAWMEFDKMYVDFAKEPRNVRLGVATDGFNPFGNMNLSYSMCPVMVFPYNLPPWMCMKKPYTFLTLLIPGPIAPGKDIDVFLRPLIDELKGLWTTVIRTYDKSTNSTFSLKAALLWTVSDFPAYGNLSGWSTKGYLACPNCNADACSYRLRDKIGWFAHRRWLRRNHSWRRQKHLFNNEVEKRNPPKHLSGEDILRQVNKIRPCMPGKHKDNPDKKRKRLAHEFYWTKKSVFFELEYWSKLLIRHNLDVMHIEKNICDNVVGTLLCIKNKSKDTVKARLDLQDMGVREELHLEGDGTTKKKHLAHYSLTPAQCRDFYHFIKFQRFPDGLASNISRCVKDGKISGLKTHDCHVLLQRLLPVGIRPYLSKEVCDAIVGLSCFFQQIFAKTLHVADLDRLQKEIVVILCKLEQIFPPAFFDVMVHLAVHLPLEAKLGGPVMYRWMYPIERRLGDLKRYVCNRARPEGSIAEGYIIESLTFCSLYLEDVETVFSQPERNYDADESRVELSVFAQNVRPCGGYKLVKWSETELEAARWYILDNCSEVEPYKIKHREELERVSHLNLDDRQRKSFPTWFKNHIAILYNEGSSEVTKELYALSLGPDDRVATYTICTMNGIKWHVKQIENTRTVQNSGIMVPGSHGQNESDFYGQLVSIVEVPYKHGYSVFLFKGDWFDIDSKKRNRIVRDYHLKSVNTKNLWYRNDPYILAMQAQQVFYFDDLKLGSGWKVIQKFQHRHVWDVLENENNHVMETNYVDEEEQEEVGDFITSLEEENVNPNRTLRRDDVEPEIHMLTEKDLECNSSHYVDRIGDESEDEEMLLESDEDVEINDDEHDNEADGDDDDEDDDDRDDDNDDDELN